MARTSLFGPNDARVVTTRTATPGATHRPLEVRGMVRWTEGSGESSTSTHSLLFPRHFEPSSTTQQKCDIVSYSLDKDSRLNYTDLIALDQTDMLL